MPDHKVEQFLVVAR